MSFLNLKQLWVSALVIGGLLISVQIFSALFRPAVNVSELDIPELKTPERAENVAKTDFSPLFARFELLQPEPEVKEEEGNNAQQDKFAESENAQAKVPLKPNFHGLNEEYQIGLIAVFEQPNKFAVLQLLNYQTGQSEFRKLSEGSDVGNYQLSKIDRLSVLLSNQTSQIELFLFKPKT